MNDSKIYFWLAQSGVGAVKLNKLLEIYTPTELWERFEQESKFKDFLGEKHWRALKDCRAEQAVDKKLEQLKQQGMGVMTPAGGRMPERLLQKEVCPPLVLYYRGDPRLLASDCLAVVGTRRASRFGAEAVGALVPGLVRGGLTVVSGLATGIDAYALKSALDSGGRPISVLASGLDKPQPVANVALFEEIAKHGLVLSEYPPGTEASKYSFPERNRILSGVSLGTLVVEAPEKSGALITAEYALEQGREVFAVPGSITSSVCKGSNQLLKDGATLTLCADDVLSQLGFRAEATGTDAVNVEVPEELKPILALLERGEASFDTMCDTFKCKSYELSPRLTMLEIMGLIERRPNNYYDRKRG